MGHEERFRPPRLSGRYGSESRVVCVKFSNLTMVSGGRLVNLLYQSRP